MGRSRIQSQGQNFASGFFSGGLSAYIDAKEWNDGGFGVLVSSVQDGITAEIFGGDFAVGARSSVTSYMFNYFSWVMLAGIDARKAYQDTLPPPNESERRCTTSAKCLAPGGKFDVADDRNGGIWEIKSIAEFAKALEQIARYISG